jgi:ParB family transcriptional regulator, chromosome partitioning protein
MAKPALGRGLGALLGPTTNPTPPDPAATQNPSIMDDGDRTTVRRMALDRIQPCPFQPRKSFPEDALSDLADSIRAQGVVQPLIVRPAGDGYELIAGERRWRAARIAGLTEVPVIVREADDRAALELALIENLQRENLNPIEEAQGFAQLIDQFQLTQEEAATRVGKSRTVVANALRLLKLAPDLQAHLRDERLSVGHAKVLLSLSDHAQQLLAADRVLRQSLNVRQTEDLVAQLQNQSATPRRAGASTKPGTPDPQIDHLHARLRERLGTKVELRYRQGRGAIQIHFFNDDDLDRVLGLLGIAPD